MKLHEVMNLIDMTPFTVGTDKGNGWFYYSDGLRQPI